MKTLKIIRDTDLGLNVPAPSSYKERAAARAIVVDENGDIALLNATKKAYHKLPGGGVEEGEDIKIALEREIQEEIGCLIENIEELGIIEEYRNNFELHQKSYCFIAKLKGEKGTPSFTEGEMKDGFRPEWVNLDNAIEILKSEKDVENYEGKFIRSRDLAFLEEFRQKSVNK